MKKNKVANVLKAIGIIVIVAGCAVMALMYMTGNWFDVWEPLIYGVGGFIPGMCFVGFAEIIKLLQHTVNLLTPDLDKADAETPQENAESETVNP